MLGSGAIMVMDDTTDIPAAALTLVQFYAHESCGKCAPCREGGTWLERILERIVARPRHRRRPRPADPRGRRDDLPRRHSRTPSSERLGLEAVPFPYKMTTICFVGPSAYAPVHSALTLFPDEFEAQVIERAARASIPVAAAPAAAGGGA